MEKLLQYELDIAKESVWKLVSATPSARENLIYMQEIGDFHAGEKYYTIREGFPSYLLKLTLSGCGTLDYGGKSYSVPTGSFFWIDCMKHQDYRTEKKTGNWRVVWVHFYGANVKYYYDSFLQQNGGKAVAELAPGSPIYSIFRSLLALDYDGTTQLALDFQISSLLNQLLSECVQATMQLPKQTQYPRVIQDCYLYLSQNFEKQITLEELGERFDISPCHLQRLFRRCIGLSPAEFLIHLRIAKAKELLRTTQDNIGLISERVGMSSQNYLTLQFKKLEGITPLVYRRQWPQIESVK